MAIFGVKRLPFAFFHDLSGIFGMLVVQLDVNKGPDQIFGHLIIGQIIGTLDRRSFIGIFLLHKIILIDYMPP